MPPLFEKVVIENLGQTIKAIDRLGRDVAKVLPDRIRAATIVLQGEIKRQASGGTIGGGLTPTRSFSGKGATGKLAQSFTTAFASRGNEFEGRVGSPLVYAAIHEGPADGGASTTVKPKKKFLAIPLTPYAARRKPREMDLQFVQARGKNPVLIEDATGVAQYLLLRSVKIPARRYVTLSQKNVAPRMQRLIDSGIDVAVKRVGD